MSPIWQCSSFSRSSGINDRGFEGIRRIIRIVSELARMQADRYSACGVFLLLTTKKRDVRLRALAVTPVRLNPENPPNLFEPSFIDAEWALRPLFAMVAILMLGG